MNLDGYFSSWAFIFFPLKLFEDVWKKAVHAKLNMTLIREERKLSANVMALKKVLFLIFVLMNIPCKVLAIANGKVVDFPGKYPHVVNADLCTAVLVSPNLAIGVAHCC